MELHILFFVLAGVLLLILIGMSIRSARREKSQIFSNTFSNRAPSTPIKQEPLKVPPTLNPNNEYEREAYNDIGQAEQENVQQDIDEKVRDIRITLPSDTHEQHFSAENQSAVFNSPVEPQRPIEPEARQEAQETPSMLMLYVVAPEGQQFDAQRVYQSLEASGFTYGEHQIFHRYESLGNPQSPTLFSAANMLQPGVFDMNRPESFNTTGLLIFMHLPSPENDVRTLKLMIESAELLAHYLGGFVLNDQFHLFDEQSRADYLHRVR